MAQFFSAGPGRVVQILESPDQPTFPVRLSTNPDDGSLPEDFAVAGAGPFAAYRCIITGLALQGESGHQLSHSLDKLSYLYAFQERVGSLVMSGLSFAAGCDDEIVSISGHERFLDFYQRNSLSATGRTLNLAIGLTPVGVFAVALVRYRLGIVHPDSGVGEWALEARAFSLRDDS